MDLNPPVGSKISIVQNGGDPTIVIPQIKSYSRYFAGLFLLFWLGMWAMGFGATASEVLAGKAEAFEVFWLGGWTVGGIFAAYILYQCFRPPVPETLTLRRGSIVYDSGIVPPQFNAFGRLIPSSSDSWRSMFPKRHRDDLDKGALQTLRLRQTVAGNRLTIDVGAKRIEIGSGASEVEREWLAALLARRYSLPQTPDKAAIEA
ncbi:MAG TPA: hypothetical protein VGM83_09645 [Devosiaceae bacterium]|jgi:hypothetical protein